MKDKRLSHGWNAEQTRIRPVFCPWPLTVFVSSVCFAVPRRPLLPANGCQKEKTHDQKT